ncbi:DUF1932 domain-containing protein [Nonomuraea sp. NPDC049141]|uniref:DUF1932 domain-containing protein n=1 Tax=Nonomuraea sp. NPDC049141 TaxID=3155500 RepID=UPI0033E5A6BD
MTCRSGRSPALVLAHSWWGASRLRRAAAALAASGHEVVGYDPGNTPTPEGVTRAEVARQLAGDGEAVIERFLTGTRKHAVRRAHEMHDTGAYLADLGVPAEMTRATEQALRRFATQGG